MNMRVPELARRVRMAAAAALCAGLAGCVTTGVTTTARMGVSTNPRFVLVKSEKNLGWGFLSHVQISDLTPLGIVVDYNLGGDTGSPSIPPEIRDKGPAVTTDAGRTWLLGAAGLQQLKGWPEGMPRSGQRTARGIFCWGAKQPSQGMCTGTSGWVHPDTGEVEGPWPMSMTLPPGAHGGYIGTSVVATGDGRVFLVAYTSLPEDNQRVRTVLLESSDGGRTFETVSTVATQKNAPWAAIGPSEPTIAEVKDGGLICIMRTAGQADTGGRGTSGPMLLARSEDGGKTWSYQRMFVPGVMPKLRRMQDGTLALAFGRPGNNVIFSVDEGRSWGGEVALTRPDEGTSGYLDLCEIAPGRLFVAFDTLNQPIEKIWLWEPKKVNAVWGTYLDVRRRW
jgi:hypothetical protein